ncbi:MAG: holo-ACP synthase [candidate division Zixibacteria bacterium]|nr:holo-ACP synthase [candidate division Zixibacteria bacterium]
MTHSIGIDLVEVDRIRTSYNRHREKFLNRVFSEDEIGIIESRKAGMIMTMAGKFAGKEAVMKALDPFFVSGEIYLKDIEILNLESGRPYVRLPAKTVDKLAGKKILISVSHERIFATAVATIVDEK